MTNEPPDERTDDAPREKGKRARLGPVKELHQRFSIIVLGFTRDGSKIPESALREGDKMWFMLNHGTSAVYRGDIGSHEGHVAHIAEAFSGEGNVVSTMRELGCSRIVQTMSQGSMTAFPRRQASSGSSGGDGNKGKVPDDLPQDIAKLLEMLKGDGDKSAKRRIRGALRAMGHKGGSKGGA